MLSPAEIIAAVPELAGGQVLERLGRGPVSDKWLLRSAVGRFVLRIDRPVAAAIGLDRLLEMQILEQLAAAGYLAAPVWCEPAKGVLLTEFVAGRVWTGVDFADSSQLVRLAGELRRLHALAVNVPELDLALKLKRYAARTTNTEAKALVDEACELLTQLDDPGQRASICHNDPVVGNVVENERLHLIDWEYAARGNPLFDLAVVLEHHGVEGERAEVFAEAYAEQGTAVSVSRLASWRRLYRLTCRLWAQALA